MRRNCYALAALAAAGLPGIRPVAARTTTLDGDDIDTAVVHDDRERVWVVTAATSASSGARVAKEVGVLEALAGTELAPLVQSPQGFASMEGGGRAVIALALEGHPLSMEQLSQSPALVADLGQTLATVHNTPKYAWAEAGVEEFTVAAIRQRHLDNMRRAHRSHPIPAAVLQRWKQLLTDDVFWAFTPRFTHQSLSPETVLVAQESVSGLLMWENAAVADPAHDLAWVLSGLDSPSFDIFYTAYTSNLDVRPDRFLVERAQLTGEFAVLEWLIAGMDRGDDDVVSEALDMLQDVEDFLVELARNEAESELEDVDALEHAIAESHSSESPDPDPNPDARESRER